MSLTKKGRKDLPHSGTILPTPPRFADAIAAALHRQYGESHGGIKGVMRITGVSERTVKNWFQAKNGPSGQSLVLLCQHSDQVFETFMRLAGRDKYLKIKKLGEMKGVLRHMMTLLTQLETIDP